MRRVAAVTALTLSALLGFALGAEAQCLITPLGPLALPLQIQTMLPSLAEGDESSTTPVAREAEGPHRALPSCDYRRKEGVPHAD